MGVTFVRARAVKVIQVKDMRDYPFRSCLEKIVLIFLKKRDNNIQQPGFAGCHLPNY
jgi:hypothetical protein